MGRVQVIVDGIKPSDIYQGRLGDCYFLSSISALAEFPSRVERLLISKKENKKGCYCVALNINGDWKEIFWTIISQQADEKYSSVIQHPRNYGLCY